MTTLSKLRVFVSSGGPGNDRQSTDEFADSTDARALGSRFMPHFSRMTYPQHLTDVNWPKK